MLLLHPQAHSKASRAREDTGQRQRPRQSRPAPLQRLEDLPKLGWAWATETQSPRHTELTDLCEVLGDPGADALRTHVPAGLTCTLGSTVLSGDPCCLLPSLLGSAQGQPLLGVQETACAGPATREANASPLYSPSLPQNIIPNPGTFGTLLQSGLSDGLTQV